MAQETITQTLGNAICQSNMSWTLDSNQVWRNSSNTTGSDRKTCDLTMIPEDAAIISAVYDSHITQSFNGSGYQTIRNAQGGLYDYANSESVLRWLQEGNRTINLLYSYKTNTHPPVIPPKTPTVYSELRYYRDIAISVVYEAGNKTWLLHYGIGGEWVPVEARGCEGSKWKTVSAYYGTNGGWTLCEKTETP